MKKWCSAILLFLLAVSLTGQTKLGGSAKLGGTVKSSVSTTVASDFAADAFTGGVDGNSVVGRTADVGGVWAAHSNATYGPGSFFVFQSARIYAAGTVANYIDAVPSSANYYSQADFCVVTAVAQSVGVTVRMSTTDDTMYLGRLVDATNWQMRKIVTGTPTTLGSTSTTNVPTAGGACVAGRLVVNGDQISFEAPPGTVVIGPVTDAAITAAGRAGVRNNGTASSTTGTHVDNFSARGL